MEHPAPSVVVSRPFKTALRVSISGSVFCSPTTIGIEDALRELVNRTFSELRNGTRRLEIDVASLHFLNSHGLTCLRRYVACCQASFSPVFALNLQSESMLKVILFVRFDKLFDQVSINGTPLAFRPRRINGENV